MRKFIDHINANWHEPFLLVGAVWIVVIFKLPDPITFIQEHWITVNANAYIERMWLP